MDQALIAKFVFKMIFTTGYVKVEMTFDSDDRLLRKRAFELEKNAPDSNQG